MVSSWEKNAYNIGIGYLKVIALLEEPVPSEVSPSGKVFRMIRGRILEEIHM